MAHHAFDVWTALAFWVCGVCEPVKRLSFCRRRENQVDREKGVSSTQLLNGSVNQMIFLSRWISVMGHGIPSNIYLRRSAPLFYWSPIRALSPKACLPVCLRGSCWQECRKFPHTNVCCDKARLMRVWLVEGKGESRDARHRCCRLGFVIRFQ